MYIHLGFVEAYSDVECEVVWHPGFNTPETGLFTLCVHKGNQIMLKCLAKVTIPAAVLEKKMVWIFKNK